MSKTTLVVEPLSPTKSQLKSSQIILLSTYSQHPVISLWLTYPKVIASTAADQEEITSISAFTLTKLSWIQQYDYDPWVLLDAGVLWSGSAMSHAVKCCHFSQWRVANQTFLASSLGGPNVQRAIYLEVYPFLRFIWMLYIIQRYFLK